MTEGAGRTGIGAAPLAAAIVVVLLGTAAIVHATRSGPDAAEAPDGPVAGTVAVAPPPPAPRTRVLLRVGLVRCDPAGGGAPETRVTLAGEVLGTSAEDGIWERLRDAAARRAEELREGAPETGRFAVEALLETSLARQVPPAHLRAAGAALVDAGVAVARTSPGAARDAAGAGTFTVRDLVLDLRPGNGPGAGVDAGRIRITLDGQDVDWGGLPGRLATRCREERGRSGLPPALELRVAPEIPTALLRQAMSMALDAGVTEVTVGRDDPAVEE